MRFRVSILLLMAFSLSCALAQEDVKIACGPTNITCDCGLGDTERHIFLEIKGHAIVDSATEKLKCVHTEDPYKACSDASCKLSEIHFEPPVKYDLVSSFYPYEFTVPPGGASHRIQRQVNYLFEPCHVPSLDKSYIKCWKSEEWVNCHITCIRGHSTMNGEAKANIYCNYAEDVWKPHGFNDCNPYMNCVARLLGPGTLKCVQPIDGTPAYCDIECYDGWWYPKTNLTRYECLDEHFDLTLPECAAPTKLISLNPKPGQGNVTRNLGQTSSSKHMVSLTPKPVQDIVSTNFEQTRSPKHKVSLTPKPVQDIVSTNFGQTSSPKHKVSLTPKPVQGIFSTNIWQTSSPKHKESLNPKSVQGIVSTTFGKTSSPKHKVSFVPESQNDNSAIQSEKQPRLWYKGKNRKL